MELGRSRILSEGATQRFAALSSVELRRREVSDYRVVSVVFMQQLPGRIRSKTLDFPRRAQSWSYVELRNS